MAAKAKQDVITIVQDVISHFKKFLHLSPKSQINELSSKPHPEYRPQSWPAVSSPVTEETILCVHAGM